MLVGRLMTPPVNIPRTGVEPVETFTPSWYLFFCAGKLSDVMCVPPWAYRDSWGNGKYHWIVLPARYQVGLG